MSLKIIKAGILDTVQDFGRYGYQHLGINPSGAMDTFSAALANALLGKELNAPVIELHFPAAQFLFQKDAIICLAGADFAPFVNDKEVPLHQPVALAKNAVLKFKNNKQGARCYLSLLQPLVLEKWLNSYSTNSKAAAGGYNGRALQKDDVLFYEEQDLSHLSAIKEHTALPWRTAGPYFSSGEIEFIHGNEWHLLTEEAQVSFQKQAFFIMPSSDRMGYYLSGEALKVNEQKSILSSPVNTGTVQLLPNGQLIVLMADHQITGGYPRIAHVISAALPRLAQIKPNEGIRFKMTNLAAAEEKIIAQQNYLRQLQNTCNLKMQNWLHANH